MTEHRTIKIIPRPGYLVTDGLSRYDQQEIKIAAKSKKTDEYVGVLVYLIDYIIDLKPTIRQNQTIAYHSWILKFAADGAAVYNLYEVTKSIDDFTEGADQAIDNVMSQVAVCKDQHAIARFPLFAQKVAVSDGVLTGLNVDAVRYASPDHMTGWFITTDLYDDHIESLHIIHYGELAFARPDLIRFLALPFGYRFNSGMESNIWFDEEVASQQ